MNDAGYYDFHGSVVLGSTLHGGISWKKITEYRVPSYGSTSCSKRPSKRTHLRTSHRAVSGARARVHICARGLYLYHMRILII